MNSPPATLQFTFDAPLPPAEVSPNARCHWRKKAGRMKEYRQAAGWAAKAAKPPDWPSSAPRYTVALHFWHKASRGRDADNAIASLKAGIDGMTDAWVWADDKAVNILSPVQFGVDKLNPRVQITVTAYQE